MNTILDSLPDAAVKAIDQSNDPALWQEYVELLKRDASEAGDAQRLPELVRMLNLTKEIVGVHMTAFLELEKAEATAADAEAATVELQEIEEEWASAWRRHVEHLAEHGKAIEQTENRRHQNFIRSQAAVLAAFHATCIRRRFGHLFGQETDSLPDNGWLPVELNNEWFGLACR
jgi:hypothetical protein